MYAYIENTYIRSIGIKAASYWGSRISGVPYVSLTFLCLKCYAI